VRRDTLESDEREEGEEGEETRYERKRKTEREEREEMGAGCTTRSVSKATTTTHPNVDRNRVLSLARTLVVFSLAFHL
jgi:hypothetical protein